MPRKRGVSRLSFPFSWEQVGRRGVGVPELRASADASRFDGSSANIVTVAADVSGTSMPAEADRIEVFETEASTPVLVAITSGIQIVVGAPVTALARVVGVSLLHRHSSSGSSSPKRRSAALGDLASAAFSAKVPREPSARPYNSKTFPSLP